MKASAFSLASRGASLDIMRTAARALLFVLFVLVTRATAVAQALPVFDFARDNGSLGWAAAHDVAHMEATTEGLRIDIGGMDPYIIGPAHDFPANQLLWLHVRLKSDTGGGAQLFYFTNTPSEKESVRFDCRPGVWEELRVPVPALGPGTHLRFDPPGESGACVLARMTFEPRILFQEPIWLAPDPPAPVNDNISLQSGDLRLVVAGPQWNDFVLEVDGRQMAIGHTRPLLGIVERGQPQWIDIGQEVHAGKATLNGRTIESSVTLREPGGASWQIRQTFTPAAVPGAIDVRTEVSVDRDRSMLYLPMLVLLPGSGSFGVIKDHAIFAGLEYLDKNEPSSSEADIIGPGSHRQTPDSMRSTLPLMAIQNDGRYIGLAWQPDPAFCALFDSPDRHLISGGHVMGILYPGSDGANRVEGSLLPYEPTMLRAGQTLILNATLIGGRGTSVIPAVQQFVALRGLPALPKSGFDLRKYIDLASAGWLDSGLGEGGKYRHALPGDFMPQPAADAAMYMEWLASRTENDAQATRLRTASQAALAQVSGSDLNFAAVSHVRYPVQALLYGHIDENIEHARQAGRQRLAAFTADGAIPYHQRGAGPDLGRTHSAPDANGLTAEAVSSVLDAATVCADPQLIQQGLRYLNALDRFADSAPRGAQTWEVPLHTPDILASAHLVRAYTLGYALTGDAHYLDQARYWAWSGVPFIYLTSPVTEPIHAESGAAVQPPLKGRSVDPVGVYSTIAVYGATQWVSPNWMGLPVQWCGLVYADALYRLLKYDPNPIWKTIADGITVSGMQQTWPQGSSTLRQGLLPDSFSPRLQSRNNPAINPGTVQADAVQLFSGAPLYDLQVFRANGLIFVHAPGGIKDTKDEAGRIVFTVEGWPRRPYDVLLAGIKTEPHVTIDGHPADLAAPHHFSAETGRLVLHLSGKQRIEIRL